MSPWNMGKTEGQVRIILAILLIVSGSHSYWILSIIGLIILYTGINHHCPVYSVFKSDTAKHKNEYFLSQLPKSNPQPIFIFNHLGKKESRKQLKFYP